MDKTKDKDFIDYSETQLKNALAGFGLKSQDVDRVISDYMRYREGELSELSLLSYKDLQNIIGADLSYKGVIATLKNGEDLLHEILIDYLRYIDYKKEISETYQESKSWDEVITTVVYTDAYESNEGFIDYVEEIYQTKIKDAKHLQKLTGIKEATLEGLEDVLIRSNYSKYCRALGVALVEGAKYKDLLQIKPQDYGLPKNWSGCLASDQYSSILWAISFEYSINEPGYLMLLPDLRIIAQDLEAPYSVLMDCFNLTNKRKEYGATGN